MSKSANNLAVYKYISAQNAGDYPSLALRPSDMSTTVIALFLFFILWLIVQINFSLVLHEIPSELNSAIAMLSGNSIKLFASIAVALAIGLYSIVYKFVLNGQRDLAAIGVAAKYSAGAVGLAAVAANTRITQFVDLVSMFENTVGLFYISTVYPTQLDEIVDFEYSTEPAKTVSYTAHTELATIFLSRIGIMDMNMTNSDVKLDDTITAKFQPDCLRRMVVLKNMVAQFCWLFFAAVVATLASIPEFISVV